MSTEIWWACTIEATLPDGRELSDDQIDRLLALDSATASLPTGRCDVIFSVTGPDPAAAVAEGYRRWTDVAPEGATVDLVEVMTAERQERGIASG